MPRRFVFAVLACILCLPSLAAARTITDALGRTLEVPDSVERFICSGPGCLRLATYLETQDRVVAVDDIEARRRTFDARPYAMANPRFKTLPVFGEFRGHDHPERILALDPMPQVIFKTYHTMGTDPVELQAKTGIPVITLNYGDLGPNREALYRSMRTMAEVLGASERCEAVLGFFDACIRDLDERTADIPEAARPLVYIGGVAHKGPHGYQSTEPSYPPFGFVNAKNAAAVDVAGKKLTHSDVAKEKILEWDPDVLFLDLSTLQLGEGAGGLHELRTDPAYQALTAVIEGKVYGMLPYNW